MRRRLTKKRQRPRRTPVTGALVRLERDYRLWALLPPGITRIDIVAGDASKPHTLAEVVGVATRPPFPRGVCRNCGCSDFDPCLMRGVIRGPCWWADRTHTRCSACAD